MPFSIDPQPEENEIECARCGAYFFYDLIRCPECGASVYPLDDEIDETFRQATDDRTGSQRPYLVLLQAEESEHAEADMHNSIFMPVLDALTPIE